jgi:thiosulfate dehydrogenase [quinone] large subunit
MSAVKTFKNTIVEDPPFVRRLFGDTRAGWIWLLPRVWLGYQWIQAASHKVFEPKWVETGEALQGFWLNAAKIPEAGRPPIAFDWYRMFIQSMLDAQAYTWFAKLVAYGELLVGIALVLGAFTGIAAVLAGFMNWNFMMAGAASTNPVLFLVAVGLILAWKVSGYVGLDFFLLRRLGTPWKSRHVSGETKQLPEVVPPPIA